MNSCGRTVTYVRVFPLRQTRNKIIVRVNVEANDCADTILQQGNIMSTNVNGIAARVTREAGRPSTTKTITQTDILGWIVILAVPTLISSVLYRVSSIIHLSWIKVSTEFCFYSS